MAKNDFTSRFAHLDTDITLERDGVPRPVGDSGIVLILSRAGGRNYGFEKHRDEVAKRWRKTHGTKPLSGEDLRAFNRDVFAFCIRGWNDDVVGTAWSDSAARELIDLEEVYETVLGCSPAWENYRKQVVDDAKDIAGNASAGS
jgi:hypothetical protein